MKTSVDRQHYIDWLRAGAMFLLVFYHTGRLFDEPGWHLKNAQLSDVIEGFNRFLDIWMMPLFFLLAGAAVWFALGSRSTGGFAKERVLRLFVPLIFGMLIIVPPQVYLERLADGDFTGSFVQWYPHTFQGTYSTDNASQGNLSWHHLWFLAYLFVFSMLLLPLFRYFRKADKRPALARIANFLDKPGAIFLPAVPLIIFNITLRPIYGYGNQNLVSDWANFLFYISVFFYGFLLVSDARLIQTIHRYRYRSLILAVAGTVILGFIMSDMFGESVAISIVELALSAIVCWCWLVAIVGVGRQLLNHSNRVLKYASDAVLPVYILHQTLIVTIGFYVIRLNAAIEAKYFLVSIGTLFGALIIYEIARRTVVTRFLFGIKTRKRPARPAPSASQLQ